MQGKTVMITGASKGIGAVAARIFAGAGANVALLARSGDTIAELAGHLGDRAIAIPCDVSRYWEVEAAVEATLRAFGGLDVYIGNAGVIEPIARLEEADPAIWGQTLDINLKGVFHGMRVVAPIMRKAGGGTIITVSSGAAQTPFEGWSHYCTAKAGALMLTRALHLEAGDVLRVMGLSPGTVATSMQRQIKASGVNPVSDLEWEDHIPPEWPARALLWMCSNDADEFRGQDISLRQEDIRRRAGLI